MGSLLITLAAAFISSPALAGLLLYYVKRREKTKQASGAVVLLSPQEAREARKKRVAASILAVVGILLLVFDGFYIRLNVVSEAGATSMSPPVCSVNTKPYISVDSPKDQQQVDRLTMMYGTACSLPKGQHAYPIVLAETPNVYYLLSDELNINSQEHTWSLQITLGDKCASGHPYLVSVILVNDATDAKFKSILSKPNSTYTISRSMLTGAQTMVKIHLIRKQQTNCQ